MRPVPFSSETRNDSRKQWDGRKQVLTSPPPQAFLQTPDGCDDSVGISYPQPLRCFEVNSPRRVSDGTVACHDHTHPEETSASMRCLFVRAGLMAPMGLGLDRRARSPGPAHGFGPKPSIHLDKESKTVVSVTPTRHPPNGQHNLKNTSWHRFKISEG
ncbi:hypothetical protein BHM03_00037492 [Ensete ventricosum]|nr:hypothetical protein BHM03_00037492 [Ensete ventricosum]